MLIKIIIKNLTNLTQKNWVIITTIFYFLTSAAPLFWYRKISYLYQFIGRGDSLSPINIDKLIKENFFTLTLHGAGMIQSTNLSHLIPANLFYYISYHLSINPIKSTLILIGFIIFISQISFNSLASYIFNKNQKNISIQTGFIIMVCGILYGYSPYVLAIIAPGHIYLLIHYAIFPIIIKSFDRLINQSGTKHYDYISLYLFFLFSAASYANVAIIYADIVVLALYSASKIIIENKPLSLTIRTYFFTCCLIFFSNSWWLINYLYMMFSNNVITYATSDSTLNLYISNKPLDSYLYLILFGKIMFNYVVSIKDNLFNLIHIASMSFLWIFFFIRIIITQSKRSKFLVVFMLFTIVIVFLLKGYSNPISSIYSYIYYHLPGFVSFRNSVNKFYGFFWLSFLILCTISICETLIKMNNYKILKYFIIAIITFISFFYIYLFIKTPQLNIFDIPKYYQVLNSYLRNKKSTNRILLLPSSDNPQPFFGGDSNYYHGINFIPEVIDYPILTVGLINPRLDKLTEKINLNIKKNRPICEYLKKTNISDIIVLMDLNKNAVSIDDLVPIISNMKKMKEFSQYKLYKGTNQNGLYLFEVHKNCISNFISLKEDKKNSITYRIINPVTIQVELQNLHNKAVLQFLTNYDNSWIAQIQKNDSKYINKFNLLFNKNVLNTKQALPLYGYANSWIIDKKQITNIFDPSFYHVNSDGTININLTLYYKGQNYVYLGLILFSFVTITGIIFIIINKTKRKK